MFQKFPKLFLYFLTALFFINLLQSYATELIFDEAYYWYYAQNLAWGYFDHPPMVALMVKIGGFFVDGELGVRFVSCVLSVTTLMALWSMIDQERKKEYIIHFFVLIGAMTLLNAYGFLSLPDTPLLFFTALFLLIYKKFINGPTLLLATVLGIVMAALMYSKYHAVLVIFFVLLSNLKLVGSKFAWFAVMISLVCYIPHLNWLYLNDFVSLRYHLFERPNAAYNFTKYTLGFFVNLLALFGLIFPWAYIALFRSRPKDLFTKALLYLVYGVILFFFISSFNRRVQTQWLIVISIPMAVIVFNYMLENKEVRTWIYRMGIANIIVLSILRLGLIYEPVFPIIYETHGNKQWVDDLRAIAGDDPVVFENSYRMAPMYTFYSGKTSFSLNNLNYRQNQYSIDDSEAAVQHKKVFYVSKYILGKELSFTKLDGERYFVQPIDNFESFRKLVAFIPETASQNTMELEYRLQVYNPYNFDISLKKLKFGVAYLNDQKEVRDIKALTNIHKAENLMVLKSNDTLNFTFKLPKTEMRDPGFFRVGISENGLHYGLNGPIIKFN